MDEDFEPDEQFWDAYEAKSAAAKSGDREKEKEALYRMWSAALADIKRSNLDGSVQGWLLGVLGEIVVKRIPEEIRTLDLKPSDTRRNDGFRDDAIKYAVAYRQAVESGQIDDPTPMKRISGAFNIDESTIRRWLLDEDYASDLWEDYLSRFENNAGPKLKKRMLIMGSLYRSYSKDRNKNRSKPNT